MYIKNTVEDNLTLQFKGTIYELGGKEVKEFADNVAEQWMVIYGFLEKTEKPVEKKEVKKVEKKVAKKVTKK